MNTDIQYSVSFSNCFKYDFLISSTRLLTAYYPMKKKTEVSLIVPIVRMANLQLQLILYCVAQSNNACDLTISYQEIS